VARTAGGLDSKGQELTEWPERCLLGGVNDLLPSQVLSLHRRHTDYFVESILNVPTLPLLGTCNTNYCHQ
jgi:hypothetical protein